MSEDSPRAVEVSYQLSDLYALTFQSWRPLAAKLFLLPAAVAIFLVILTIASGGDVLESLIEFPWGFIFGLIALILLLRVGISPLTNYFDGKRRKDLGPIRFELNGEGVRIEAEDGRSLLYWPAVRRVKGTRNRLFLFAGSAALILPRRAFTDSESFQEAADFARSCWLASRL